MEADRPVAITVDGHIRLLHPGRPLGIEVLLENAGIVSDRSRPTQRVNSLRNQHVEITRRAQLPGEPFELALERLGLGAAQHFFEYRYRGPQAAQADPHLMDAFRVTVSDGSLVGQRMIEAGGTDGAKRITADERASKLILLLRTGASGFLHRSA